MVPSLKGIKGTTSGVVVKAVAKIVVVVVEVVVEVAEIKEEGTSSAKQLLLLQLLADMPTFEDRKKAYFEGLSIKAAMAKTIIVKEASTVECVVSCETDQSFPERLVTKLFRDKELQERGRMLLK